MRTNNTIPGIAIIALVILSVSFITAGTVLVLKKPEPISMTNDEIISEIKKCNDANLLGQVIFDKHRKNVIKVQCITKIKESVEGPVISSEA